LFELSRRRNNICLKDVWFENYTAHTTRMCGKLVNYDTYEYMMYEETLNVICGYVEYPAVRKDLRSNHLL